MRKLLLLPLLAGAMVACAKNDPKADPTGKTLVVYFSNTPDLDATSGATELYQYNGERVGATQFVAKHIIAETGADEQRITVDPNRYPNDYDGLATLSKSERDNNIRPALTSTHDLSDYQNIIIGFPIWWYQMPMVMYSFFDQYDLSNKNVYVFTTHEGSGLNGSPSEIRALEPDANISDVGYDVRGTKASQDPSKISKWLKNIGL